DPGLRNIKGLGYKGRDNILRDTGYFDRVPIDFHERNFMMRTGIFHLFAEREADPRDYYDNHHTLSTFCKEVLGKTYIQGEGFRIHLADSPGVFDLAVWSHCSQDPHEEGICGSTPACFEDNSRCPLFGTCWWSRKERQLEP
ncbi:MAG: hypothetical protein KAW09_00210, partial [Thermoplasmata archaeon]|nr:hypothetical protein [Thermoplasmata archaeon]